MSRVYVEFNALKQIGGDCKTVSDRIDVIGSELKYTIQRLDWDVKYKDSINTKANQLTKKLDNYAKILASYQKFMDEAYEAYIKLDTKEVNDYFQQESSFIDSAEFVNIIKDGWIIGKPYIFPNILGIISPIASLPYLTSGIAIGKVPSFFDSSRALSSNASADWLGYEVEQGNLGVNAWLGKASARTQNEVGYAGVKASIGKVKGEIKGEHSLWGTEEEYKKYKNGKETYEEKLTVVNLGMKGGASVSGLELEVEAGLGSDMLGVEVEGEGIVGEGSLEGDVKFSIGEKGIDAYAEGEAMVSAVKGEAKGTINILGIEITGKIGGYAGALGVEGKIGVEENKWVLEGGAAAILGVSGGIEIGFNEQGWCNFVDTITFWDRT